MIHKIIDIAAAGREPAKLHTYFLGNFPEIDMNRKRKTILICPGGGYEFTSDREAEAVAIRFNAMGHHAAILHYHTKNTVFPQALLELCEAVAWLREHSGEYGLDKDKIIVCGFSAGGHLAGSLGVFWDKGWLYEKTKRQKEEYRPNGLILSYPVINSGEYTHKGSMEHLTAGIRTPEMMDLLSLEKQVTDQVPPVFLWHTWEDECVPVENSLFLAAALRKAGVSLELHIYPHGMHGLSLANEETQNHTTGLGIEKRCQSWIDLAGEWVYDL